MNSEGLEKFARYSRHRVVEVSMFGASVAGGFELVIKILAN